MQIVHSSHLSAVRVFALSIAAGLVLAPPLGAEARVEYEITDLGTLPGGTESSAFGINESGEVTGSARVAGGDTHGFIWLPTAGLGLAAETMHDLGTLDGSLSSV